MRDAPENSSLTIAVGPSRFFHDRVVFLQNANHPGFGYGFGCNFIPELASRRFHDSPFLIGDRGEFQLRPSGSAQTRSAVATTPSNQKSTSNIDTLRLWDDKRDGRITGAEARCHGIAPVQRSHLAYRYMRDGDWDGMV